MNRTKTELLCALALLLPCTGCFFGQPRENLIVHRRPWQMIDPLPERRPMALVAEEPQAVSDREEGRSPESPKRPLAQPEEPETDATPAEVLDEARRGATQLPSADGFVEAVQLYDYEPGAIYEVVASPGFVTILRLRVGEEILHLAAGDTSRWLIDTINSGVADPHAALGDALFVDPHPSQAARVSVLIKPRRPLIQTNLVIATNQRTYLIDLKSVDTSAYHSVVEWTYPQKAINKRAVVHSSAINNGSDGTRNYAYEIKVRPGPVPRWTPVSVFDDGHRVHVQFPDDIDDLRRPPLFIVDAGSGVRLVNYHVAGSSYVVHELFDRAELRLDFERVAIDRIKPKPDHIVTRLLRAITGDQ